MHHCSCRSVFQRCRWLTILPDCAHLHVASLSAALQHTQQQAAAHQAALAAAAAAYQDAVQRLGAAEQQGQPESARAAQLQAQVAELQDEVADLYSNALAAYALGQQAVEALA